MDQPSHQSVKASAHETIDTLPENSTWDEVIYRMYVRQKIEEGLADSEAGRFVDEDELRKQLGLQP